MPDQYLVSSQKLPLCVNVNVVIEILLDDKDSGTHQHHFHRDHSLVEILSLSAADIWRRFPTERHARLSVGLTAGVLRTEQREKSRVKTGLAGRGQSADCNFLSVGLSASGWCAGSLHVSLYVQSHTIKLLTKVKIASWETRSPSTEVQQAAEYAQIFHNPEAPNVHCVVDIMTWWAHTMSTPQWPTEGF